MDACQIIFYVVLFYLQRIKCVKLGVCSKEKSVMVSGQTVIRTLYFCCRHYEESSGICEECDTGYESNGTRCEPCKTGQFGIKCADTCHCKTHESCDHIRGCIQSTNQLITVEHITPITEKTAKDSENEVSRMNGYTENTNVVPTNYDDVARTDEFTKNTNFAPTDFVNVDNGQFLNSAFLPQIIIIVIGSTMIIVVIFLIFKEHLSKNIHVNVMTRTAETEVVDPRINMLNEKTNNYENINESIIMQSDINVQLNLRSRCGENSDPYSRDTGNYLNIFTASLYENAGRKEEEKWYENYSTSSTKGVDDTSQNLYEPLRGQRNSTDDYSSCNSVLTDEETETEYATIVGEICLYKF